MPLSPLWPRQFHKNARDVPQLLFQQLPRTSSIPRHHRADRYRKNIGSLLISEFFHVDQQYNRAIVAGDAAQSGKRISWSVSRSETGAVKTSVDSNVSAVCASTGNRNHLRR